MTRQVSPVSGTSNYTYNEHGELATETDARNIVTTRTTDALDRVTAVSYPDPTLTTTYSYDTGAFAKGRLTGITRHGEILNYTYDRFDRFCLPEFTIETRKNVERVYLDGEVVPMKPPLCYRNRAHALRVIVPATTGPG